MCICLPCLRNRQTPTGGKRGEWLHPTASYLRARILIVSNYQMQETNVVTVLMSTLRTLFMFYQLSSQCPSEQKKRVFFWTRIQSRMTCCTQLLFLFSLI